MTESRDIEELKNAVDEAVKILKRIRSDDSASIISNTGIDLIDYWLNKYERLENI